MRWRQNQKRCMFFYFSFFGITDFQPAPVMATNSARRGAAGTAARDIVSDENFGGVLDGNVQLPIFSGAVVDINNSPDRVNPKLS